MPQWIWWVIWPVLIFGSAGYLAFIGFELAQKGGRAVKAFEATNAQLQNLITELEKEPKVEAFEGNLLDDPSTLARAHASNLKKREARREAEQRRLINKLVEYRPDESEFRP